MNKHYMGEEKKKQPEYKYAHDYEEHYVKQQYLPDELEGTRFYEPGELGYEKKMKERLERLRTRQ